MSTSRSLRWGLSSRPPSGLIPCPPGHLPPPSIPTTALDNISLSARRGLLAGARALASQRWQGGGAGWGHLPLVAPASQQWNAGAKSCQPGTEASWRSAAFGAAAVGAAAGMAAMAASAEVPEGRDAARWSGLSGDLTLYQYEVCPFCCKAKAALDYFSVPYKVSMPFKWAPLPAPRRSQEAKLRRASA